MTACTLSEGEQDAIAQLITPCTLEAVDKALRDCGYSARAYLEANPDLRQAGLDECGAHFHFLWGGYRERRPMPCGRPMQGIQEVLQLPIRDDNYRLTLCQSLFMAQVSSEECAASLWHGLDPDLIGTIRAAHGSPYVIAGDSHSHAYVGLPVTASAWPAPFHLLCSAASAIGLANPAARSGYGRRLLLWAQRTRERAAQAEVPVFLKFGQVDAEFVSVFRRIESGETRFDRKRFEAFTIASVAGYAQFIRELATHVPGELLRVCSIFPPVLSDEAWSEGYVNAHIGFLEAERTLEMLQAAVRTLEIPDLDTRTALHRVYNERLSDMCDDLGIAFIDDFRPLLNAEGRVREELMAGHVSPDHHLPLGPLRAKLGDVLAGCIAIKEEDE